MNHETVGVVTLVDLKNYGNRLQNFATHELFRQRGIKATTIEMRAKPGKAVARALYYAAAKDARENLILRGRYYRSWRFTSTHVRAICLDPARSPLSDRFDYFSVGSDQVWNPNDGRLGGRADGVQCLANVPAERKMLVAPSFGLDELSSAWGEKYSQWLQTFAHLSCRETRGVEIISSLTERDAEVAIDPTMAIEPERWREVARTRDLPPRPYLVTLLLGSISLERRRQIVGFAAKHGLDIVNLADPKDPIGRRIGPQEFLALIDNARCVMTDSYHCSIFALLFQRPLAIFDREGPGAIMSSRIETLVSSFDLSNRVVDKDPGSSLDAFLESDYTNGTRTLDMRRVQFVDNFDSELARLRTARVNRTGSSKNEH
ncbi:polysaccharide pyruvyl transferase family protein [Aeromicrobium chenweiae]|uniref:Polysaccharide pyruvyl transferase domain-containing protein n=1 Tax=Aeromicrobium chenweiae TaxID=2079793 RepID=A0A2S0WHL9_9ACTN|nr:polysaccharide pyruvyl transferase family protein [Aeromicrobium chenweiae]AWB90835.1 hypothetical protein C3E78_00505 [Aeromicrobium chenweiae]TGN31098.1 polysaccharide pyruvyl transferase family protein [Aeromicrobium chenweiae]